MPALAPPRSLRHAVALALAATVAVVPRAAFAQSYLLARGISFSAGAADFDLTGSGVTPTVALRADAELTPWLVGELGVSALRPNEELPARLTYVVPELQLQLQRRAGRVRPYLGAGGGWFYAIGPNRARRSALSASAAAGVRLDLRDLRFGLRAEARVRGIDRKFSRQVAEATGGVVWRF